MQKFRYLSHTADIEFVGYGSTLKKGIENSALALLNIMLDIKEISNNKSGDSYITIKESAQSRENLVWFTLQDILSKIDEKKINAFRFDVQKITEKNSEIKLTGRIVYKKIKSDNSLLSVKAVTPHDLSVKKEKGIFSVHVVVDV